MCAILLRVWLLLGCPGADGEVLAARRLATPPLNVESWNRLTVLALETLPPSRDVATAIRVRAAVAAWYAIPLRGWARPPRIDGLCACRLTREERRNDAMATHFGRRLSPLARHYLARVGVRVASPFTDGEWRDATRILVSDLLAVGAPTWVIAAVLRSLAEGEVIWLRGGTP